MAFQLQLRPQLGYHFNGLRTPTSSVKAIGSRKLNIRCCSLSGIDAQKMLQLVLEVKEQLGKEYGSLPVGKHGRDDEEMILWYLKDRKFSVKDAVSKLAKAIRWRHEFGVSELSEDSVRTVAKSGKAYLHDYLDVYDRPVLIVDISKHIPGKHDLYEDERLCVFLIEKALSKLPSGNNQIIIVLDLRRFGLENADLKFVTFLAGCPIHGACNLQADCPIHGACNLLSLHLLNETHTFSYCRFTDNP